jgi:hypothetical protein
MKCVYFAVLHALCYLVKCDLCFSTDVPHGIPIAGPKSAPQFVGEQLGSSWGAVGHELGRHCYGVGEQLGSSWGRVGDEYVGQITMRTQMAE